MSKKKSSIHPVDIYVGKKLKERRMFLKMSQQQLGRYVGLTFQQIQKYERGQNRISCSKLFEFVRFLKIDVAYFFEGLSYDVYNAFVLQDDEECGNIAADSGESKYIATPESDKAIEFSKYMDELIFCASKIKNIDMQNTLIQMVKALSNSKSPN